MSSAQSMFKIDRLQYSITGLPRVTRREITEYCSRFTYNTVSYRH